MTVIFRYKYLRCIAMALPRRRRARAKGIPPEGDPRPQDFKNLTRRSGPGMKKIEARRKKKQDPRMTGLPRQVG